VRGRVTAEPPRPARPRRGGSGRARPPFADAAGMRVVPEEEWDGLLARLGSRDVYFTLGYHRVAAELEPLAQPLLLRLASGAGPALPLLVRPLPGGEPGFDATTAYGYGGPVAGPGDPAPAEFGEALDGWARANGLVATFFRFHPLAETWRAAPPRTEVVPLTSTVAWNVAPGRDLEEGLHRHHRRTVRRARRAGVSVQVVERPPDLRVFRLLYESTMRRRGATPFYFFGDAYWERMREEIGGALVLVEASMDGVPVAGLLCMASPPYLHYHLGGSSGQARGAGASHLCFLTAALWAQAGGFSAFHLGGGVGARPDSLYEFKHRFDPESPPRPFFIGKLVHDPDRYLALTGRSDTEGFFPPWRDPAAS